VIPGTDPPPEGQNTYPGVHGSTNWMSPSYDAAAGLFFIPVREEGTVYYHATVDFHEGAYYTAGGIRGIPNVEPSGSIQALDPSTGALRWEFPLHSPPWAGLLSTAGGLVFGGTTEGNVFALDSSTGKPLWDFQAGGPVAAGPISYEFEGKQYIVITAGRALIAFAAD
jgi:alcohol dehydrogenase (cytochrome c)